MSDLLLSYAAFAPLVRGLKSGASVAEFVGSGAESSVWRASVNGADYAVKLLNDYSPRGRKRDIPRATAAKIGTGLKGLGIPGLEQLRAASPQDGVTIYEFAKGVNLSRITEAEAAEITQQHLAELRTTVWRATQAGILFDGWNTGGGNAFFSPQAGFTLIDYWDRETVTYEQNLSFVMKSLGGVGLKLASGH